MVGTQHFQLGSWNLTFTESHVLGAQALQLTHFEMTQIALGAQQQGFLPLQHEAGAAAEDHECHYYDEAKGRSAFWVNLICFHGGDHSWLTAGE